MIKLSRCPRCLCEDVEFSSTRDLDILSWHIECTGCNLWTFSTQTLAFVELPNFDHESMSLKYNAWCKTNPKGYCEEKW